MINYNYKVVAKAVRMEYDNSGTTYLVFELIDEDFKRRVKENWMDDIDVEVDDKNLILKEK